jgi:hypothetical protein
LAVLESINSSNDDSLSIACISASKSSGNLLRKFGGGYLRRGPSPASVTDGGGGATSKAAGSSAVACWCAPSDSADDASADSTYACCDDDDSATTDWSTNVSPAGVGDWPAWASGATGLTWGTAAMGRSMPRAEPMRIRSLGRLPSLADVSPTEGASTAVWSAVAFGCAVSLSSTGGRVGSLVITRRESG